MIQNAGTGSQERILVVDDEKINLKYMNVLLTGCGYRVRTAENGPDCLAGATADTDLILLDIMMPDMDGFETCRRLKENPATREIPVIFLSALQDAQVKTRGFEVGGVDYVGKPFDRNELLARVRTHLTIRSQRRQLQLYAEKLEQLVEERTRQLIHAERLSTLGTFSAAIVHEINNPLGFVSGTTELLRDAWKKAKPAMEGYAGQNPSGCSDYITKPIDSKQFMDRISRYL